MPAGVKQLTTEWRDAIGDALVSHGHYRDGRKSPTYVSWDGMRRRGVAVCDRWRSFEAFLIDMGERPPGARLARIDPGLGFELDNCRWAGRRAR